MFDTFDKLKFILTKNQRSSIIYLFFLMVVGAALETLGIGLVLPALILMVQADIASSYPILKPIISFLGYPSQSEIVIYGMMSLVLVYLIKNFFLGYLAWRQSKFIYGVQSDFSQFLFSGYLHQTWVQHIQRNSSELIRNAMNEVNVLVSSGLSAGLSLATELLVMFFIVILLIALEPVSALTALLGLGLFGWVFHKITSNYLKKYGAQRMYHDGLRIQHLQQGLNGLKDVKILGRESAFSNVYKIHAKASANNARRAHVISQIPRLLLEVLAISGITILILMMVLNDRAMEDVIPMIGLFGVAVFRVMPSVNRILLAVQGLRYGLPVIDVLYNEKLTLLKTQEHNNDRVVIDSVPFENSITIKNVTYTYPNSNNSALQNISLTIPKGTAVGFIGESGSGKSTLIDLILGLLHPDKGEVLSDAINIEDNLRSWQNKIGYVPQNIYLTDDSLINNIAFGVPENDIDQAAVIRAAKLAQLHDFLSALPEGYNTKVGENGVRLSGGQIQRIGIARALYSDPPILVLDEATSALDNMNETSVMSAVSELNGIKTILIIAHRLTTLRDCSVIYELQKSRLVKKGTYNEIIKSA
jgi:ATP-binding cassette, subfamily B, bacterial PglK